MLRICAIGAEALPGFLIWARAVEAQEPTILRGRAFALANCARCHAIGRSGKSPLPKARPPEPSKTSPARERKLPKFAVIFLLCCSSATRRRSLVAFVSGARF